MRLIFFWNNTITMTEMADISTLFVLAESLLFTSVAEKLCYLVIFRQCQPCGRGDFDNLLCIQVHCEVRSLARSITYRTFLCLDSFRADRTLA